MLPEKCISQSVVKLQYDNWSFYKIIVDFWLNTHW